MSKKTIVIEGKPLCVSGTMRCRLLLAAAMSAAGAFAADFSNTDGTGLLSNKANWGGTLPDASTAVTIVGPGSFSTAADVTTGNATLKGDGLALALGAYSWAVNGYLYCEQAGTRVVLDGGTYTTTGETRVDNGGAGNVHLVLTNGATVTSAGRFNCGWGAGCGSSLTVAGAGSSFVANGGLQGHLGNTSANHLIHVADHGNFETKSTPFNIGQALNHANTNNVVLVETGGTATFHNTLNIGRANTSSLTEMIAGENKLIVRSGGKVEAKNGINVGGKWYGPSNLVEVTDGGSLTVSGASFRVGGVGAQSDGSGSSWNRVRVVGGSYSQLYGAITIGDLNGNGYSSDYNSFFAGTNAALNISTMNVGNYGAMNEAEFDGVTNNMAIGNVTLGQMEGASNNVFRASNMHSLSIGTLTVGKDGNANMVEMAGVTNLTIGTLKVGSSSWSNRAEIVGKESLSFTKVEMGGGASGDNYALIDAGTSGAALDISSCFSQFSQLAGFGNEIELRNFMADCAINAKAQIGWGTGVTNATLRVGSGCVFNTTNSLTLNCAGPGCRLVVDGAEWTHGTTESANDGYVNVGVYNPDNHLEVINGGKLLVKASTCALGNKDRSSITVGSGSEMELFRIRVNGSDNRLTISNGTLTVTKECSLPSTSIAATVATNNVVAFLGDAPRLIGAGTDLSFLSRNATDTYGLVKNNYIHFAVPKYGYPAATPPLETTGSGKNISISAGNFITADVSQFAKRGGKTLLMRASGTISITNISELGSKLPEHATLTLSADNKELWLRMPDCSGLRIIFR